MYNIQDEEMIEEASSLMTLLYVMTLPCSAVRYNRTQSYSTVLHGTISKHHRSPLQKKPRKAALRHRKSERQGVSSNSC